MKTFSKWDGRYESAALNYKYFVSGLLESFLEY